MDRHCAYPSVVTEHTRLPLTTEDPLQIQCSTVHTVLQLSAESAPSLQNNFFSGLYCYHPPGFPLTPLAFAFQSSLPAPSSSLELWMLKGSILFPIYMSPLGNLMSSLRLKWHLWQRAPLSSISFLCTCNRIFSCTSNNWAKDYILRLLLQLDVTLWLYSDRLCEEIFATSKLCFYKEGHLSSLPSQWLKCGPDSKSWSIYQEDRQRLILWWPWSYTNEKEYLTYLDTIILGLSVIADERIS